MEKLGFGVWVLVVQVIGVVGSLIGVWSFDDDVFVLGYEFVIFGVGCFWGVEFVFQCVYGVLYIEVGYIQGYIDNFDYYVVCFGDIGIENFCDWIEFVNFVSVIQRLVLNMCFYNYLIFF